MQRWDDHLLFDLNYLGIHHAVSHHTRVSGSQLRQSIDCLEVVGNRYLPSSLPTCVPAYLPRLLRKATDSEQLTLTLKAETLTILHRPSSINLTTNATLPTRYFDRHLSSLPTLLTQELVLAWTLPTHRTIYVSRHQYILTSHHIHLMLSFDENS